MPKDFERKVAARGGATRWRNVPIPGRKDKYLKVAVTRGSGPEGGKTVAHVKKKQTEDVERIKAFFGRSVLVEGKHKSGCCCGFCKNKGKIGDWKKNKPADKEPEEPKGMDEGIPGEVKLSKGSGNVGSANKAYGSMTSKQAMTPEFKPKAYIKAAGEVAGLPGKGQMSGFKNKSEGETTSGARLPKKRPGESVEKVVAALLDS